MNASELDATIHSSANVPAPVSVTFADIRDHCDAERVAAFINNVNDDPAGLVESLCALGTQNAALAAAVTLKDRYEAETKLAATIRELSRLGRSLRTATIEAMADDCRKRMSE